MGWFCIVFCLNFRAPKLSFDFQENVPQPPAGPCCFGVWCGGHCPGAVFVCAVLARRFTPVNLPCLASPCVTISVSHPKSRS